MKLKIAKLPGDGIGPEVVAQAVKVVDLYIQKEKNFQKLLTNAFLCIIFVMFKKGLATPIDQNCENRNHH